MTPLLLIEWKEGEGGGAGVPEVSVYLVPELRGGCNLSPELQLVTRPPRSIFSSFLAELSNAPSRPLLPAGSFSGDPYWKPT